MRGSAEILRSHLSLTESDGRLFDILLRESDRLNNFVQDFLNFARPRDSARQPVELTGLLRDSVTLLQNSPEVKGKHSVVLSTLTEGIQVLANPDQLRQVFWNLAQNALRAMPRGGTFTIVAEPAADGGATIVFRDQGAGMTGGEKARLFQPFQAGFAGGTGLGLSIVYQIVKDHGGEIEIESEKGKGTTVVLHLPPFSAPLLQTKEVKGNAVCSSGR
jgi:two-component system sensor histidine kinase PilS (NtrC family)